MPGDSEQPVTVAQLCVSEHLIIGDAVGWVVTKDGETEGYGFRPATVADLVSALRAEGVLVVEIGGEVLPEWPEWARAAALEGCIRRSTDPDWVSEDILYLLAEAQK